MESSRELLIEAKGITKIFGGNKVLDGVSIALYQGQIHGLCGENGAGKSTLIKILSGSYIPEEGSVIIGGHHYKHYSPLIARQNGIEVIHQEIILVPQLSIAENVITDARYTTWGFFSFRKTCNAVRELMDELAITLDPKEKVENLTAAEQQLVKILKALAPNPKVLIMDEPTAMFNMNDTEMVLGLVKRISQKGMGIIYISHHLKEIKQVADVVSVLRDGKLVSCYDNSKKDVDLGKLTCDMVGRPVDLFYKREQSNPGETVFEVKNLRLKQDSPSISFKLRCGEILGITGMVGAGRSEIIRAIYGLDKKYAGEFYLHGKQLQINVPIDSIKNSIGFISEDRQKSGLILPLSVLANITFLRLPKKSGLIDLNEEKNVACEYVEKLNIKTSSIHKVTGMLSGGNQQKVILAKWLHKGFDIMFLDEPTKGIDVNAKFEIYKLLHDLTSQGKSFVVVSSDMPEVVSLCDRVLVVRDGQIRGEFENGDITEENIIKHSLEVS